MYLALNSSQWSQNVHNFQHIILSLVMPKMGLMDHGIRHIIYM